MSDSDTPNQLNSYLSEVHELIVELLDALEPENATALVQRIAENRYLYSRSLLSVVPVAASSFMESARADGLQDSYLKVWLLGVSFSQLMKGERSLNIEISIVCYQELLRRSIASIPSIWVGLVQMDLATAYKERVVGGREENVEKAIEEYNRALEHLTRAESPQQWAMAKMNIATAYHKRIRGDRADNMETALEYCKQVLNVVTPSEMPELWASTMTNLGLSYKDRILGNRSQNVEAAIEAFERCLQVRNKSKTPEKWVATMTNLALAYSVRIKEDHNKNLKKAIEIYEQVLEIATRDNAPFLWAQITSNLAVAYKDYTGDDIPNNVEQAISFGEASLQEMSKVALPYEWATATANLGLAYAQRKQGEKRENIERAIEYYEDALEVFTAESFPHECRRSILALGRLYASISRWSDAVTANQEGLLAIDSLYESSLSQESKNAELEDAEDIFHRTAYAQAKVGDLTGAVVTLERGRARGLSAVLQQDVSKVEALKDSAPDVYENYRSAVASLRQIETVRSSVQKEILQSVGQQPSSQSVSALNEKVRRARQLFQQAVDQIRQQPGYEDFLLKTSWRDIARLITKDQPLVYIAATTLGGVALVVYKPDKSTLPEIKAIWLDGLTNDYLVKLIIGKVEDRHSWVATYESKSVPYTKNGSNTIDRVAAHLWESTMSPIVEFLEDRKIEAAVLIPNSYLSFLPLHAAWTEDAKTGQRRYALDNICFSYSPNAQTFYAARDRGRKTTINSLLTVNEPLPTTASSLPFSAEEVEAAAKYFRGNQTPLHYKDANRTTVMNVLPEYDVLHFSCHGTANIADPLEGGLLLSNDRYLTLQDILSLKLDRVRLAILSACETGVAGADLPDEVVSLPSGFIQAGVAGVIASLWSVPDLSTAILITRFYHYWKVERLTPPVSLWRAQQWIRTTSNAEKSLFLDVAAPRLSKRLEEDRVRKANVVYPVDISDYDSNDLSHPFHWAAFTYVGW